MIPILHSLLPAFGSKPGEKWFETAYNWDIDQIYQWLEDVMNGKTGGPRALDPGVQTSLPDGVNYDDPNLQPRSHFPRSANEEWGDGTDQTKSKWRLIEWPNKYGRGPKNAEVRIPYFSPYDLLGCFLSLLGPAPQAANKYNYFLPLTAVYGRWCSRIAGKALGAYHYPNPGSGMGTWPFMFQCTWHDDRSTNPQKWFFLGSALSGDPFLPHETGTFKSVVQGRRFHMLYSSLMIRGMVRENDYENQKAPDQVKPNGTGKPFGNCAETYPFAEKMFSDKNKNKNLYGLALQRDYMRDHTVNQYDLLRNGVVWNNLTAPCMNCAYLIHKSGALATNFAADFQRQRAPVS
ncbi:hypothetical protein PT974_01746 [Cladobotryum mycophilum]|uniref:Uncharacterized protein n=1 Tax=Cladobotryum mycophilum TaxID=491253 RepID=A0ABR0SWB2_9HYPO